MQIKELFEMQRKLDEHIVKEKGLEGQDLLPEKILALQVELAELANEWRGFKFWSNDQEPRGESNIECPKCHGEGTYPTLGPNYGVTEADCEECDENHEITINPLLEEYVDCLHFILSIGNDLGMTYITPYSYICPLANTILGSLTNLLGNLEWLLRADDKEITYTRWICQFIGLGKMLGFEWEQIVQAYKEKNKVNHERQENGY